MKAVISIYRRGEEKPIERYKARISVTEDSTKQGIDNFKKHVADFLGLKEQANKLGLGSFDPKLYRLVKGNGKTENYSILTRALLKAGPQPCGPRAATAQRSEGLTAHGPRRHGGPGPGGQVLIFHIFFCPAVNPRACTDLHLVWACKL